MNKKKNIISVTIKDKDNLHDLFNKNRLSKELGGYIYNNSLQFSHKEDFSIEIKTEFKLDDKEKEVIVDMIREFFGLNIRETINYYKYSRMKRIILFIIGIILICCAHFTEQLNDFIFSEVLLIIGWFAIWEVFGNISYAEAKNKFQLKYLKKLVNCKITIEQIKETV